MKTTKEVEEPPSPEPEFRYEEDEEKMKEDVEERTQRERKRTAPFKFEEKQPKQPSKAAKTDKEPEPKKEPAVKAEPGEFPEINPRTGQPYVRGKYVSGGPGSRGGKCGIPANPSTKAFVSSTQVIDLTKKHGEAVEELHTTIAKLNAENSKLKEEVSEYKTKIKMMEANSQDAVGFAHAKGLLEQQANSQNMFQQGLAAGIEIARGGTPAFPLFGAQGSATAKAGPSGIAKPMRRLSEEEEEG